MHFCHTSKQHQASVEVLKLHCVTAQFLSVAGQDTNQVRFGVTGRTTVSPCQVWLPMLLARYRFELARGVEQEVDSSGVHLRPKDGLKVHVHRLH